MAEKLSDFSPVTLPRHGAPPLTFRGKLLAEASSKSQNGARQNRWHELALYRSLRGVLIASVGYRTRWQEELDRDEVKAGIPCAASDVEAQKESDSVVIEWLQRFDWHLGWEGHPAGSQDCDQKNRRLAEAVQAGYRQAVSDLLSEAGIVEEIE